MTRRKLLIPLAAVLAAFAVLAGGGACSPDAPSNSPQTSGQKLTEQAFDQQQRAVPYPASELRDSLERRNLRERLLRTNDPSRIGYVYVISFAKPIGYYTIRGKVSSTQSQMTTSTLVERHRGEGGGNITYEAPGDDGSYGPNEPGIFFFTTEGVMVTTSLDYMESDQPLPVNVPKLNPEAGR